MDAEKFDKVVLDLLYEELDELTRASAIRHTEQSGRAKALYSELRATRQVGVLPLVEPPADLEERILAAEKLARADRPLRQRLGAFVSIAASYAMRPQLGMAAVLLLMVGSSLLLLRVKPGEPSSVQVTERGVPESDKESVAVPVPQAEPLAPADEPAAPQRTRSHDAPRAEPTEEKAVNVPERARLAPSPFEAQAEDIGQPAKTESSALGAAAGAPAPPSVAGRGSDDAPARSTGEFAPAPKDDDEGTAARDGSGCATALPRYEAVIASPSSPAAASAARFAAADCYVRLGRIERARSAYTALLAVPDYAARARQALDMLPESKSSAPTTPPAAAAPAAPSTEH